MKSGWISLGPADGFEPGRPRAFEAGGREVFVCRVGESFHCGDNVCSHAEFPLADGDVEEGAIICPLHGARFDLATGAPLTPPADTPIRVYRVRVDKGELFVDLSSGTDGTDGESGTDGTTAQGGEAVRP